MDEFTGRVYVAGHRGLVGRALVRALERRLEAGAKFEIVTRTRAELDLTNAGAVRSFFEETQPSFVFVAAAKVGGIKANAHAPVDFLLQNLQIQNNVIDSAHASGVGRLLFLGSSCVYPKLAPQPIREDSLLTGPLEPTNQWYAIAKIAGIKLCDAYREQFGDRFISAMPTNLYGPWDNFDPETSHALPGMIYKFDRAKSANAPSVTLWGTGSPRREWLHVDDMAEGCLALLAQADAPSLVNVGVGRDCTIRELAEMVRDVVGYKGKIEWDTAQPDGTPQKLLDVSRISALGWKPQIELKRGLTEVYDWFVKNRSATGARSEPARSVA